MRGQITLWTTGGGQIPFVYVAEMYIQFRAYEDVTGDLAVDTWGLEGFVTTETGVTRLKMDWTKERFFFTGVFVEVPVDIIDFALRVRENREESLHRLLAKGVRVIIGEPPLDPELAKLEQGMALRIQRITDTVRSSL